MDQGESRELYTSGWIYDDLPHVRLEMSGPISVKTDDDFEDDKTRSLNDKFFNWRIDEDDQEFVIRFSKKPEAPSHGPINVDVKIEGGLSTQPDGSGLGNGEGNKVSKFSLSFEISHDSSPDSYSQAEWPQPEEHEVKFFDHPEHKLLLAPENYYNYMGNGKATCDVCTEPITEGSARWVYECSNNCDYCVHAKCAQLARTIRHPSHLKHSLQLLRLSPACSKLCDVCKGGIGGGLHYNCAKCDFDLHPECPDPEEAPGEGVRDAGTVEEAVPEMTPELMQMQQMRLLQQQERQLEIQRTQNRIRLNTAHYMAATMVHSGFVASSLI